MKFYGNLSYRVLWSLFIILVVLLFVVPSQNLSAESGAKTSPPPIEFVIQGAFDPNHQYLEDGYSILNNLGDGKIELVGITKGKEYIELLGVNMKLQKWTGTTWIDFYTSPTYTDSDARIMEAITNRTVDTGYYYRIISTHWAEESTAHEEGVRTGVSVLVN